MTQVDRVHLPDEPVHFSRRGVPVVAVNIDERELRPLDPVFLGDQSGFRLVFLNRRRLLGLLRFRRRLNQLGPRRAPCEQKPARSH